MLNTRFDAIICQTQIINGVLGKNAIFQCTIIAPLGYNEFLYPIFIVAYRYGFRYGIPCMIKFNNIHFFLGIIDLCKGNNQRMIIIVDKLSQDIFSLYLIRVEFQQMFGILCR